MGIERDLSIIEEKLNALSTKQDKISYLQRLLFKRKKALIEFERVDLETLHRLQGKTKKDYEKYTNEFDNDNPVFLHPSSYSQTAQRLGLQNIKMLAKRLRLQFEYDQLGEEIKLFESKVLELEATAPAQKTETVISKFKLRVSILPKADFIRIVNALSEMKAFGLTNTNELSPNKKDVMIAFGNLVGLDLSSYHTDLNKALEKSEEKNFEIFDKLKEKASKIWNEKDQNSKK